MRSTCLLVFFFFVSVGAVSQNIADKEKLVEKFYFKGLELTNTKKDSSFFYYRLALQHAEELQHHSDAIEILFGLILTARKHGDIEHHQIFLQEIDSILTNEDVRIALDDYQYYENRFIYEKATYFYDLLEYDQAKRDFQKLYTLLSKKELVKLDEYEYNLLIHTTNYLALIYSHNSKYDLAETYFNRSLNFIQSNPVDESETYRLATLQLLAQLHRFTQNYKKSNTILNEVLGAYKVRYAKNKGYKNNVNAAYGKLVEIAIDQGNLQKALSNLQEAQEYLLDNDPFYKDYLILYGDIYSGLKNDEKSLESYQEALRLFQEYRQNQPHQDIAEVQGKIAELYLKQKNYQEGLKTVKIAFNAEGSNIKITDYKHNPNPTQVFSKTQLLHLLDVKLQLLQGTYEKASDASVLEAMLKTSNNILETFDLLKTEFDSKLDKQFLAEKAYPIFHRMMGVAFMAYKSDHSPEVLELALNIAEKNKDFVLLEALRNAQAVQYGDVPQKVMDKEAQLRAEITHFEKEIFDTTGGTTEFSDQLFILKQKYYGLLDTLKQKYPKYHDLKYGSQTMDLATIRNTVIGDGNTLLSYTMTDNYLYIIVLDNKDENFIKLPFSEADREDIRKFYRLLSKPDLNGAEEEVIILGENLFDKLLKEPLKYFKGQNLTIIPDGELYYLPFDILHENGSYLLKTKSIGYGNSVASLIALNKKRSISKNKVLAFAPNFTDAVVSSTDRQFGKLLYNDDEVANISSFYDTETVLDEKATLASFKMKNSHFNMLHLATHASANDEYPDYSYLAFSQGKDSSEGNILYIKDLYNITLNADMVTLSACQTGIGKLQKGQGMLSLSKGFYYAGAKSLVNTLWKINDKSSVKLMKYFYEGLSNGQGKSEALRKAKLKYLASTDDNLLKHPYYWSAFVVSGDVSPISPNHFWEYTVMGVLILGIVLLYIVGRRNFFRSNRSTFNIKINMKR